LTPLRPRRPSAAWNQRIDDSLEFRLNGQFDRRRTTSNPQATTTMRHRVPSSSAAILDMVELAAKLKGAVQHRRVV
jgi:hypothetical protein